MVKDHGQSQEAAQPVYRRKPSWAGNGWRIGERERWASRDKQKQADAGEKTAK